MGGSTWLMLVTNLPGRNQTLRMRIWRALRAGGAEALRDGVYVLPDREAGRALFEEQAVEVTEGGGAADILPFASRSPQQLQRLKALFDRAESYAAIIGKLAEFRQGLARLNEIEARRRLAVLRRELAAAVQIDFFPGPARDQAERALADAEVALNARFSTDEPHEAPTAVRRRDAKQYRRRVWATRERLWVDRVCCAWLIRRFIDPRARFRWLKRVGDCPKRAVGFDFDGAEFTHARGRVTFEMLLASFGLENDAALVRLGALVHYLDAGGVPVPEAAGFAAIMTGARAQAPDDDALLASMTAVLDHLYAAYGTSKRNAPAASGRAGKPPP
jgi:hypothetical protein